MPSRRSTRKKSRSRRKKTRSKRKKSRSRNKKSRSCCISHRGKREGNAFRYTGGKAIIASDIHNIICKTENKLIGKVQPYLEPFAGAMSVALKFALDVADKCNDRKITVCDFNPDITKLWQSLKNGETPPKYVSEEEYNKYKSGKGLSPKQSKFKGYVGSVFAFGGAMFGAYRGRYQSREKTKAEGAGSYNKVMKVVPLLKYITVKSARSYANFTGLTGMTIYCDPPYETPSEKSNPNDYLRGFDHEKFWETMRKWSKHNLVFISELESNIPRDFKIIWTKEIQRSFRPKGAAKGKVEALCIHSSKVKGEKLKNVSDNESEDEESE
jgi:site-specific DNA-adenine methylase